MQWLQQIMGIECYPTAKERFYSYKPGDIGRLEIASHVVTTQVVYEIEAWTTSDDTDQEFEDDDTIDNIDYRFSMVQSKDDFIMYQFNAIYSFTTSQTSLLVQVVY